MPFEKIKNIIGYQFKPFGKGDAELQKQAFEYGKKMFQENSFNPLGVNIYWVKQKIKKGEWNNYFSQTSSYCPLQKDEDGVWVGFCLVERNNPFGYQQFDYQPCNDEELRQIDLYRRAINIRPFPTEEVSL